LQYPTLRRGATGRRFDRLNPQSLSSSAFVTRERIPAMVGKAVLWMLGLWLLGLVALPLVEDLF